MHESDPRADVRDVPDPFESGGPGGEVPAHEVGAGVDVVGGDGGADLPARLRGSQLLLAHDGADRVRRDRHALAAESAEIARLRAENRELRAENEFLKKAAAFFAKERR